MGMVDDSEELMIGKQLSDATCWSVHTLAVFGSSSHASSRQQPRRTSYSTLSVSSTFYLVHVPPKLLPKNVGPFMRMQCTKIFQTKRLQESIMHQGSQIHVILKRGRIFLCQSHWEKLSTCMPLVGALRVVCSRGQDASTALGVRCRT